MRCAQCGKKVAVPKWSIDRGLKLHFCSEKCRQEWGSVDLNLPEEVIPDGRPKERSGDWEDQALKARKRDGFTCRLCGITEKELGKQLDVHHIIPYRLFESPTEANRLNNLITLCRSCHNKIETEMEDDLPLFVKTPKNTK